MVIYTKLYIQSYIYTKLHIQSFIYTKLYIQSYILKLYIQRIIQEFNLSVRSHVSITFWCKLCSWQLGGLRGGRGRWDGCFKPTTYFDLYHYLAMYTYISDFAINFILKNNKFLPKFNFLASYSSLFLKSNLAIFWA